MEKETEPKATGMRLLKAAILSLALVAIAALAVLAISLFLVLKPCSEDSIKHLKVGLEKAIRASEVELKAEIVESETRLKKRISDALAQADKAPKVIVTAPNGEELKDLAANICTDARGQDRLVMKVALKNEGGARVSYPLIKLYAKDLPLRDEETNEPGYRGEYLTPEQTDLTTLPVGESVPRTLKFPLYYYQCSEGRKKLEKQRDYDGILKLLHGDEPSARFKFKIHFEKAHTCPLPSCKDLKLE